MTFWYISGQLCTDLDYLHMANGKVALKKLKWSHRSEVKRTTIQHGKRDKRRDKRQTQLL